MLARRRPAFAPSRFAARRLTRSTRRVMPGRAARHFDDAIGILALAASVAA
jgi:hypothetical protein